MPVVEKIDRIDGLGYWLLTEIDNVTLQIKGIYSSRDSRPNHMLTGEERDSVKKLQPQKDRLMVKLLQEWQNGNLEFEISVEEKKYEDEPDHLLANHDVLVTTPSLQTGNDAHLTRNSAMDLITYGPFVNYPDLKLMLLQKAVVTRHSLDATALSRIIEELVLYKRATQENLPISVQNQMPPQEWLTKLDNFTQHVGTLRDRVPKGSELFITRQKLDEGGETFVTVINGTREKYVNIGNRDISHLLGSRGYDGVQTR